MINETKLDMLDNLVYGANGWYWEMGNGRMGVVVTNHKLLNKHFNPSREFKYGPHSEMLFYMSKAEFDSRKVYQKLRVPILVSARLDLKRFHDNNHR